jgi:phosphate transport system permease protein
MNSEGSRSGRTPSLRHRHRIARTDLAAHGEPWLWLTAGSLAAAIAMIVGLLALIAMQGLATFWPVPLEMVVLSDGRRALGERAGREPAAASPGHDTPALDRPVSRSSARRLLRTANHDEVGGSHFEWFDEAAFVSESRPEWATAVERVDGGRFHGFPSRMLHLEQVVAEDPEPTWQAYQREHPVVRGRWREAVRIDKAYRGDLQRRLRRARLAVVQAGLDHGADSPRQEQARRREEEVRTEVGRESRRFDELTTSLRTANAGWVMEFQTANGHRVRIPLADIVRAWQPNRLSATGALGVYASRWGEFLSDDPRAANSAGGVFPAIWGTVTMTLIMAVLVAPFGVLAALYLREYAGRGPITTAIRVAINNLAGVPSIVYGAFGLGFFCYGLGVGIDELFFKASLVADSQPTFGTGGLLWASLTLALLTLPVVIVATEEALSAVPNSMREGSYACGAGQWQTIRRIVLPRALPGIMTGLILAMARGAGEVAPLMLVGVKKLALDLPIDGTFPFIHPEREFMHLAYLIYDVGFQSPDAQAARPMVFTITLLLVAIIALLNLAAVWIRGRLRRRFVTQQF